MKILFALVLLLGLVGPLGRTASAVADKPLNVLLLVADDLRPELRCYGVEEVHSPNIDRLARKGMLFRNAYVQYPVCNPSRASLLSGLRPNETGIFSNDVPFRSRMPDLVALPQLFRECGYTTTGIGKIFHLGQDANGRPTPFQDPRSWDHFFDSQDNPPAAGRTGTSRNLTAGRLEWCEWRAADGGDEDQPDGVNVDEALRVLENRRDTPFFLALGIHKPHDPFVAPRRYFDLYPEDSIRLVEEPADRSPQVRLAIPNRRDFADFTDRERREFKRAYYACVSYADAQIGRVLDALDRHSLWEDTIVILIGDHGYHLGEHEWWNKVTVYELGARAPLIMWVPGAAGMGKATDALVEFVDLYPTLVDYAGLEAPHRLSGKSLRPALTDPSLPGKQAAYTQVRRGTIVGRSVRTARWRYTEWGPDGEAGVELYDHQASPREYHNHADDPAFRPDVLELQRLLEAGFPPATDASPDDRENAG